MPTPLSSSSSQEIFPISPPLGSASTSKRRRLDPSATTLPKPKTFVPKGNLRDAVLDHLKAQEKKETSQGRKARTMSFIPGVTDVKSETSEARRISPRGKRKAEESSPGSMSRTQVTNRMISTLGKDGNAITNSDLYSRTDHFVSAATGHQQSNRGGGSSGAMTYWAVRTAKMEEQAREKSSDLFKNCVFYLNGSTGPRVSNLQVQHLITANGGRFQAMCNASCTHIVASGGLSGSKTQKWINGQAGRGASKRTKVVKIDWILDCVEKGKKLNEAAYGVIVDPSQHNLLGVFAPRVPSSSK